MKVLHALIPAILLLGCSKSADKQFSIKSMQSQPAIEGKTSYLNSPFVTAGNRVYMIGHQNGTFPDLGWHITGEMGGIWSHPVKLMDGFTAALSIGDESFCLTEAEAFSNYPVGNTHRFTWSTRRLTIERSQFVPDDLEGMVIAFTIVNGSDTRREVTFTFTGKPDLRPTWLGERTGMRDSTDEISYSTEANVFIAKDRGNAWYTAFGSAADTPAESGDIAACADTAAVTGTLRIPVVLEPGEEMTIPVFITGSTVSEKEVLETLQFLRANAENTLKQKIRRYESLARRAELTIDDKNIEQMYTWLKYNTDWLVRTVPGHGTGLSAGLPDYPWWFGCDNAYALQGVLASGNHELARQTIDLVFKLSRNENGNGRIIHEVSTNGAVFNPGNVNETAQFISLLHTYYAWTGDHQTVKKYWPDVKKGIDWLLKERDPDHNGYPNGNGMMEIHGLDKEMIDVAVYTQQALESAALLASSAEPGLTTEYRAQADMLRKKINLEWWHKESSSFADFIGTASEARVVIDAAITRADTLKKPWAVAELQAAKRKLNNRSGNTAHVVYRNWVVNTPMETGIADRDKALAALKTSQLYENPFGVFVTGIDRTEEADSVVLKSRRKIFSYTGAVMTLPTGVNAIASARYGLPDQSLEYLNKLQRSFSFALPGSMYEVSPDFGMMTQAWNIYGVAVPIVQYYFGIQPQAWEKSITFSPDPPSSWNNGTLKNVPAGDNDVSVSFTRNNQVVTYVFTQTLNWKINFRPKANQKVLLNGKEMSPSETITVTENKFTLEVHN